MNTPNSSLLASNFLITGGCGFIGTSLIKNLISEGGHYIRVLDNLSVGTRDDLERVCKVSEKQKVNSKESEKEKVNSKESGKRFSPPGTSSLLTFHLWTTLHLSN